MTGCIMIVLEFLITTPKYLEELLKAWETRLKFEIPFPPHVYIRIESDKSYLGEIEIMYLYLNEWSLWRMKSLMRKFTSAWSHLSFHYMTLRSSEWLELTVSNFHLYTSYDCEWWSWLSKPWRIWKTWRFDDVFHLILSNFRYVTCMIYFSDFCSCWMMS